MCKIPINLIRSHETFSVLFVTANFMFLLFGYCSGELKKEIKTLVNRHPEKFTVGRLSMDYLNSHCS